MGFKYKIINTWQTLMEGSCMQIYVMNMWKKLNNFDISFIWMKHDLTPTTLYQKDGLITLTSAAPQHQLGPYNGWVSDTLLLSGKKQSYKFALL